MQVQANRERNQLILCVCEFHFTEQINAKLPKISRV